MNWELEQARSFAATFRRLPCVQIDRQVPQRRSRNSNSPVGEGRWQIEVRPMPPRWPVKSPTIVRNDLSIGLLARSVGKNHESRFILRCFAKTYPDLAIVHATTRRSRSAADAVHRQFLRESASRPTDSPGSAAGQGVGLASSG